MTDSTKHLTTTDRLFRVAIAIKGLDGGLQLIASIALTVLPPTVIIQVAHAAITRDLLGDPRGILASHLWETAGHFADVGTRWFAIIYLLLHGVLKLGLVIAMLRKIMPAYPLALIMLTAFVVFELIQAMHKGSIALVIFAALDIAITVLVIREYLRLRHERTSSA